MQIFMPHPSSPKVESLSFNKPLCDSDVRSSLRTTGLNHTRLIINELFLTERYLCLHGLKTFEYSLKREFFLNDMSNEEIEDWVGEISLTHKWQREVLRGEAEEKNKMAGEANHDDREKFFFF